MISRLSRETELQVVKRGAASERASRRLVDHVDGVITASRARWHRIALDVRRDVRVVNRGARSFLLLQRPLFFRAVDLAEVVNAGVLLGCGTGANEVGDRDRGEE